MTFKDIQENQEQYLREYNLISDFHKSECNWNNLISIAKDFNLRRAEYIEKIQTYLAEISNFDGIHSYRYRIKGIDSLLKKIIKKTIEKQEKITVDNYRTRITDLIGIRVLYVFKSDYYPVHEQIWKKYEHQMAENIHIKLRKGDKKDIFEKILKHDPMIEDDFEYRAIHYTMHINDKETKDARLEIQSRTIFEEGWSEINHKLVYKNKNVSDFLILSQASSILSALVGNCDTLGDLMQNIYYEYYEKISQEVNNPEIMTNLNTDTIMHDVLESFIRKY